MRRRAFVCLFASFVALLPFVSPLSAADGTHVSGPIAHDNLAIYLVHGTGAGGTVPLTLQEALANGQVTVKETGSVNELTVENIGKDEVFIQAGDIVKGGRQDRVLSVDLLLPPRSGRVPIAVFCVEHGRWTARGNEDGKQFVSALSSMPSQEVRIAMRAYAAEPSAPPVAPGLGRLPAAIPDTSARQMEIWSSVAETQNRLASAVGAPVAAAASPSSLQLSLENEKLKQAQEGYVSALQSAGESADDIVGYVFAVNGRIDSADVYASNALFRKMWPKLLAANVTEAIGEKNSAGATAPSVKEVESFLAGTVGAPESVRAVNASVRLATRDGDGSLFAESRRADDSWVHRNYLAK